jgi:hypothetical protein
LIERPPVARQVGGVEQQRIQIGVDQLVVVPLGSVFVRAVRETPAAKRCERNGGEQRSSIRSYHYSHQKFG